jgi:hypothetical protein
VVVLGLLVAAGCHDYRRWRFTGLTPQQLGTIVSQEACFATYACGPVAPSILSGDLEVQKDVRWSDDFRARVARGESGWCYWRLSGGFFFLTHHYIDHVKLKPADGGAVLSVYCETATTALPDGPALFYRRDGRREAQIFEAVIGRVRREYPDATVVFVDLQSAAAQRPCP